MDGKEAAAPWASAAAVDKAAGRCLKGKGGRLDAVAFRMCRGEEVLGLAGRLAAGSYSPEPGITFVVEKPKHREVHAAAFRDRVIHHLVHPLVEAKFEPAFISDSFACRRGRGTHAAAARLRDLMRRVTRNGAVRAFALSMDIQSFFASIHKPTLLGLLRRKCPLGGRQGDGLTPWQLIERIVGHDAASVARRRGDPASFARVPPHKHLGAGGPDRGLPIGNLTSQLFANVYLNALDQFVKRTLGAKQYVRYVDDFVLLHTDPATLVDWEARIRAFLAQRLQLSAHPTRGPLPVSGGIDFVGYIVRPGYVLPRRRVVRQLEERLAVLERPLAPTDVPARRCFSIARLGVVRGPARIWTLNLASVEALRATWAAYEGHLRHADAFLLRERLWAEHPTSARLLRMGAKRRFALPRLSPSFAAQVGSLRAGLDGIPLVVQVGAFAELPSLRDARRFGLKPRICRRGRRCAGVRLGLARGLVQRALASQTPIAIAVEDSWSAGNVKARRLAWLIEPLPRPAARPPPRADANGQFLFSWKPMSPA